jgi:hypothetical protein
MVFVTARCAYLLLIIITINGRLIQIECARRVLINFIKLLNIINLPKSS